MMARAWWSCLRCACGPRDLLCLPSWSSRAHASIALSTIRVDEGRHLVVGREPGGGARAPQLCVGGAPTHASRTERVVGLALPRALRAGPDRRRAPRAVDDAGFERLDEGRTDRNSERFVAELGAREPVRLGHPGIVADAREPVGVERLASRNWKERRAAPRSSVSPTSAVGHRSLPQSVFDSLHACRRANWTGGRVWLRLDSSSTPGCPRARGRFPPHLTAMQHRREMRGKTAAGARGRPRVSTTNRGAAGRGLRRSPERHRVRRPNTD